MENSTLIPLQPINKAFFDALLASDADSLAEHAKRMDIRVEFEANEISALDGPTTASEKTADWFCMSYQLPPHLIDALGQALDRLPTSSPYFDGLRNLLLVDAEGKISERGRWKLISSLPTTIEQANLLDIPYREVVGKAVFSQGNVPQLSAPGGRSSATEQRVFVDWFRDGWQGFHDEGTTFGILAKLAWLAHKKDVVALVPKDHYSLHREGRHFCQTLGYSFFWVKEDNRMVSPPEKTRLILVEMIKNTTPKLLEKGFKELNSEHEKNHSKPLGIDLNASLCLLSALGPNRISDVIDWHLKDYRIVGGWPDLTLVKDNTVKLVEVKKKDLLMFHQARAIELIKRYFVPGVISEVRLERVR